MEDLLIEYVETFGDSFPLFCLMDLTDEEIIKLIKQCLKENKPYEVEQSEGVQY